MDEIPQTAVDHDVQRLLQVVWDKLEETDRWPTFAVIERVLWREHRINAAELIARTPQALLYGGRPQGGAEPAQDGQICLTVAGAATCTGPEQELEVIVTAARLAAESYLSEDPQDPHVSFTRVADELSLDGELRSDLARKSGMLLVQEPWRSNTNVKSGDWTIWVDSRIRYYAGVETLDEYRHARQAQLAARLRSTPSPTHQDPITGQIIRVDVPDSTDTAGEPQATAEGASHSTSHPITPILTTGVGLYVVFLAVVQATKAVWAQVLGSILVGLGLVALFVSWRSWFRRPKVRKAALAITVILAIAVVAVTIRGNKEADTMASNSVPTSAPSPSTTPVHGTASITVEPRAGHAGITVSISAKGFAANEMVRIEIFNGALIRNFQGPYQITDTQANPVGEISVQGRIPAELCCPKGYVLVRATGRSSKTAGTTQFTLT